MNLPLKKTKIVCTIGPASQSPAILEQMIRNGMNVARLNFAHGDFESHRQLIADIRSAAAAAGERVALLADLPGPKMRIGHLVEEPIELERDQAFTLVNGDLKGDANAVSISFEGLPRVVRPGNTIFLNDGLVQLKVERIDGNAVHCRVMVGGHLRSHKGVNFPGIDLGISAFTDRDRECLEFALGEGVDAIGESFVQGPDDVKALRRAAADMEYDPFVIAKIERSGALENIDAILSVVDGIMVARGDLGVEVPIEEIAVVQKGLIRKANLAGKPVITATQMLLSMVNNRRPTRAEVTDVSNAILDGTDAIMLSEESASGIYPVEAVAVMTRIARVAEAHLDARPVREALISSEAEGDLSVEDLISLSVHSTVRRLTPAAVITPTETGTTARRIARFRLPVWIAGISANESTCQNLQFSYGVYPVCQPAYPENLEVYARDALARLGITKGLVILTQGPSAGNRGGTNRMEIIDLAGGGEESAGSMGQGAGNEVQPAKG
ncbi:MAG: pyruvate kinase [Deltaproteobacteria bacterium]|nr:pyruvate kinase [Deltaproteobacteria bacterium]